MMNADILIFCNFLKPKYEVIYRRMFNTSVELIGGMKNFCDVRAPENEREKVFINFHNVEVHAAHPSVNMFVFHIFFYSTSSTCILLKLITFDIT